MMRWTWRSSPRLAAWLAAGIGLAVILLTVFGVRASREGERSSVLLVQRRVEAAIASMRTWGLRIYPPRTDRTRRSVVLMRQRPRPTPVLTSCKMKDTRYHPFGQCALSHIRLRRAILPGTRPTVVGSASRKRLALNIRASSRAHDEADHSAAHSAFDIETGARVLPSAAGWVFPQRRSPACQGLHDVDRSVHHRWRWRNRIPYSERFPRKTTRRSCRT